MRRARTAKVTRGSARGSTLVAVLTVLLACTALAPPARADQGDSYAGLFLGTTTYGVQSYTTHGGSFGGLYGYEYAENRLWTLGATFASTTGTTTDTSGTTYDLSASTAEFTTGLLAYFTPESAAVRPYLGAGVSLLAYNLDFTGTTVGKTKGNGPGVYGRVGLELRLTPHFTLIPQFGLQAHSIRTESGSTTGMLSGGLIFALRITD